MKILLAEDNSAARKQLASFLCKWGYDVIEVCDGNEAWELIQEDEGLQILLFNWMMPKINGVNTARQYC